MTWTYGMTRRWQAYPKSIAEAFGEPGAYTYEIREVYGPKVGPLGKINKEDYDAWTEQEIAPLGESADELRLTLERMLKAAASTELILDLDREAWISREQDKKDRDDRKNTATDDGN